MGCNAAFRFEQHRQRKKAAKARAAAERWRAVERVAGKSRQKPLDRDAAFQPRHVHPGAQMDAGAEGEMAVGVARHVEAIGIGKLLGRGSPRRCRW